MSRREAGPARTVTLPYYATVLQGGTAVVAKRLGNVAVTFAEGQVRGTGRGQASAYVDRAAATLPADIQERITRKRKAGDQDAAIDPLSIPEVRAAVSARQLRAACRLPADAGNSSNITSDDRPLRRRRAPFAS